MNKSLIWNALWRCNWINSGGVTWSHVFCFLLGYKLKSDQGTIWKNSGNKDQYDHNEKVSDTLTQALWALSNQKFDCCKELIGEADDEKRINKAENKALREKREKNKQKEK